VNPRFPSRPISLSLIVAAAFWLIAADDAKDITETLGMDFSTTKIEIVPARGPVSMLVGQGGNIGVSVGGDGAFMVDDQFAPLTERIITAVRTLSDKPIQYVINTHWHYDHTGGNRKLGKRGIPLVAHDNARQRLVAGQVLEPFGLEILPEPDVGLPEITFSDTLTFHLNGESVRIFHVENAHTDGDSIVHFQGSNVIHMGDTYFNGIYPFVDVSSGGSVAGMLRAVDRVLALADEQTKIIPGHGPMSNREELMAYRDMLVTVKERVSAGINNGKSANQMVEEKILMDLDPHWGNGMLKAPIIIRIMHTDLTRNAD
jgi:cyclase